MHSYFSSKLYWTIKVLADHEIESETGHTVDSLSEQGHGGSQD